MLFRLTTPNAVEDVAQKKLSVTADGNAKWYSYVGKSIETVSSGS
jgi:hypothetical protein